MARFGTNFNDVDGDFGGRTALPDPGIQDFEITKVTSGVQAKGNDVGKPYFSIRCTQISGEATGTRSMSQFLGLGTTPWKNGSCQKAAFKGFMTAIGREDLLHPDGDSSQLIGTTFRAKVYHDTDQKGQMQANLTDIEPMSHAVGMASNAPAQAAQPAAQVPQEQSVAAPAAPPAAAPVTRRRAR